LLHPLHYCYCLLFPSPCPISPVLLIFSSLIMPIIIIISFSQPFPLTSLLLRLRLQVLRRIWASMTHGDWLLRSLLFQNFCRTLYWANRRCNSIGLLLPLLASADLRDTFINSSECRRRT
jgi:hypothetical protein